MDVLKNENKAVIITFFLPSEKEEEKVGDSYIFYGDNTSQRVLDFLMSHSERSNGYTLEFVKLQELEPGILKVSERKDLGD